MEESTRQTNAERIQSMTIDGLAEFIFKWQVNIVANFFKNGFTNALNLEDLKEWLRGTEPSEFEKGFDEQDGAESEGTP